MFANIYLYLHLCLSSIAKRDVVEYDAFRFQREIICNAVCEEYVQISIYIYPLFYQMVSHDMLLSMINSNFSQIPFVMLMRRCFAKLYLFLPLIFWNGVKRVVVEYDELRFQPEIICNAACEECLQISIHIYPLFYQKLSHAMLLSMKNSNFSQK